MKLPRIIHRLFSRSRFVGLVISPSPVVADGMVVLKRAGREVGSGMLSEFRSPGRASARSCDEIVVSPGDWHSIASGMIR